MKSLKLLILLVCTLVSTAAFAQVEQIFDGHSTFTNIDVSTNYVSNTLPNAANGDTATFNGSLPGNLALNYVGNWASGPGSSGVNLNITAAQTGSLYIDNLNGNGNPPNFAFNNLTIAAGAGAFTIGSNNFIFNYGGRPAGVVHSLKNDSSFTATIGTKFHMIAGGGSAFTFAFSGAGNWQVNSFLVTDNTPNNNTTIQVDGPGTVTWYPSTPSTVGTLNSIQAININGGSLILTTNYPKLVGQAISLNGVFQFNSPQQPAAQVLSGTISGGTGGILQVSGGTLSLSGANTYTGTNLLSGGELLANRVETPFANGPIGQNGVITFAGGTLGIANTFDYSPRFDTAAGQQFNLDIPSGQTVTLANPLVSAGGTFTKFGAGTLILAGTNTYNGLTTVSAGKLIIQGQNGSGPISVLDGQTLGVIEAGVVTTPSSLTVGTASGAVLEFNNVTNTAAASIAVTGGVTANGPITINIAGGKFSAIGQTFPLFTWGSGPAPAVVLGSISGAAGTLKTNGNSIVLTISSTPYVWTGASGAGWDTTTPGNWQQSGVSKTWVNGVLSVFDDTATGNQFAFLTGALLPASVTVNSTTIPYTLFSSTGNDIEGTGGLTKSGNSILTLSGPNAYTGVTTIKGGVVTVDTLANGGTPSSIGAASSSPANIVLDGGTLQYTGPQVSIDRQITLGVGGGTVDVSNGGALALTNNGNIGLSGLSTHVLNLAGSLADTNTLYANIVDAAFGASSLIKSGGGNWILTGTNTYTGPTTISGGILQVGVGGPSGTLGTGNILNNSRIDFNRSGTLTVNGAITGSGAVTNDGSGTVILVGNNTYSGGTFINAGKLQIGNNGSSGSLNSGSQVVVNGTLSFNNTGLISISGFGANITGTGNVIFHTGTVKATAANSYSGWTQIDPGAIFQPSDGNAGTFSGSGVITNNGTIFMTRQDAFVFGITNNITGTGKVVVDTGNQNAGLITLAGTNTYTGGTVIQASGIELGDGINAGGSIVGGVVFANTTGPSTATFTQNRLLVFNRPDAYTFTNPVSSTVTDGSSAANSGSLLQLGSNVLTVVGNVSYPGTTTVGAGTLQFGNGGTGGNIGTGNIILTNNGVLVINRSATTTINGIISDGVAGGTGGGSFVQMGTGTTFLNATNTFVGSTTVSNGTLVIVSGAGDINVSGGTLAAGLTAPQSVLIGGNLNINSGTILFPLNRSLSPSNSVLNVTLSLNYAGGSVRLTNVGPSLVSGDRFVLFSQPVPNGHTVPIISPNFTVINNLETDGSITIGTIIQPPAPKLNQVFLSGTNIVISATNNAGTPGGTYALLATNNLTAPLSTWPVISTGTFDANGNLSITNPVGNSSNRLFYILRAP